MLAPGPYETSEEVHDAHAFLQALAIVLGVAAVTTVLFQWLRQPVVLGYLLAGLIVGPHVPIPLVAEPEVVQTLSEIGVILLMFSVGLEMRIETLWRLAPTSGITAVIQCSVMLWVGFVTGRAFGWTSLESLFAGAIIAISSTTIVAKAFAEQKVGGRLREQVLGILIVEDLIAILLMAALTAIASGSGLSASEMAATLGRLAAFLVGLIAIGLVVVPRMVRGIVKLERPETTVVASMGICFAIALLAREFGYSVALGAFLAGSLVAESGAVREIEHRIEPVRDVFAAIFFVSVGMLIDPALIATHWLPVLVFTLVVMVGTFVAVGLGAFLTGSGTRLSIQSGMSLAQIGEFSFIIAGLGLTLGATRDFLYPVAVAVSAITTLATPFLIRASGPVADYLDSRLPKPIQTFVTLYGTWLEQLRTRPVRTATNTAARRLVRLLVLDAALIAAIVVGASVARIRISGVLGRTFSIGERPSLLLLMAVVAVLVVPFAFGVVRLSRRLGSVLADAALPHVEGALDLADAPRKLLIVTLQLAILLLIGTPLVAITQPFLPGIPGAALLLIGLVLLAIPFWRNAANLQGHVRAGAQLIAEALAKQARAGAPAAAVQTSLEPVQSLLPGLGAPAPFRLEPGHAAVGKTLAEVHLRASTGATVLAISRGGEGILVPSATERLREGDVLALAGTDDAVEAAKTLLIHGETKAQEPPPGA